MPETADSDYRRELEQLLHRVAVKSRACQSCEVELLFVPHSNGKRVPYSQSSLLNHFADCLGADRFRKKPHSPFLSSSAGGGTE